VPQEYKNLLERRTAVTPAVAAQLVKNGIPVFVQRSARRAFSEKDYSDAGARLIDYELITDAQGKYLVAFGRFAGIAGMNDALWTLGQKLSAMGINSPLTLFRPACVHADLIDLFGHLKRLGK